MAIQFECTACSNPLEVSDGSEGQQAKCPACSAVLEVPAAPLADPESSDTPTDTSQASINPYASTSNIDDPVSSSSDPTGELSVRQIDVGWTLTATWELYRVHFGVLIGLFLITTAVSVGSQIGITVLQTVVRAMARTLPDQDTQMVVDVSASIVGWLLNQAVNVWCYIASIRIMLQVARNQAVDFGLLFKSGPFFVRSFFATILFTIATFVGLILLIIPGIFLMVTFWNYSFFIVDRNCGIAESFRLCREHAEGNRLNVLVVGLIAMGLSLLGCLAFCLGWIATTPFSMFMLAIVYLTMTGQPFVQPKVGMDTAESPATIDPAAAARGAVNGSPTEDV